MLSSVKTKILYQNCDTFLQVNLKKKDQVYENHLQFLNNNTDKGFLKVRWEKTATRNVLKYNVSNMIALSEYIKQSMSQEKYFELLGQFQKILEYCSEYNLNVNNLILSGAKNIYYDVEHRALFVAYLPLVENTYESSNIVKLLYKINKEVNVSISNSNVMNNYNAFLEEHLRIQKNKKDKNSCFSHNHLYNFLHDNYTVYQELDNQNDVTVRHISSQPQPQPQYQPQPQSQPVYSGIPEPVNMPVSGGFPDSGDHTVLVSVRKVPEYSAYLTDAGGRDIPLDHFPFTIGRKGGNDLALVNSSTVSGIHAAIVYDNGGYFIEDKYSSNGTYLNNPPEKGNRITRELLSNGDTIFIHDVPLRFFLSSSDDFGTVIVGAGKKAVPPQNYAAPQPAVSHPEYTEMPNMLNSPDTVKLPKVRNFPGGYDTPNLPNSPDTIRIKRERGFPEAPGGSGEKKENGEPSHIAYIVNSSSKEKILIYSYPFTSGELSGIIISQDNSGNRHSIFIENVSCPLLEMEGTKIAEGEKSTIFSGCNFFYRGIRYTFYEEN